MSISTYDLICNFFTAFFSENDIEKALSLIREDSVLLSISGFRRCLGKSEIAAFLGELKSEFGKECHIAFSKEANDAEAGIANIKLMVSSEKLTERISIVAAANGEYLTEVRLYRTGRRLRTSTAELLTKNGKGLFDIVDRVLPGGIFSVYCDESYSVSMINKAMIDYCGYTDTEEFITETGGSFAKVIHPDDIERVSTLWRSASVGEKNFQLLFRIKKKDGEYGWLDVKGRKLIGEGAVAVIVCLCIDASSIIEANSAPAASSKPSQSFPEDIPSLSVATLEKTGKLLKMTRPIIIAAVITVIVLVMTAFSLVVTSSLNSSEQEGIAAKLTICEEYISKLISADLRRLDEIANDLCGIRKNESASLTIYAESIAEVEYFSRILIDFADGTIFSTDEYSLDYYREQGMLLFDDGSRVSRRFSDLNGKVTVAIRSDMTSPDGSFYGTVYAFTPVSEYSTMKYGKGIGEADAFIVDRSGLFVEGGENGNESFIELIRSYEGAEVAEKVNEDIENDRSNALTAKWDGQLCYLYYVPVSANPLWYLVLVEPLDHIIAHQTLLFILTVLFGLSLIAAFLTIMLYRRKSERLQSNEKLYRERLLRLFADNNNTVFIIINTVDEKIEYISDNIGRLLGIDRTELLDKPIGLLKIGMLGSKIASFLKGEESRRDFSFNQSYYNPITRKNQYLRIGGYISEVTDNSSRTIICISDSTDEILQQLVLKNAVKASDSANKAKSDFLANMSHDIRTPMNGIIGLTSLAMEEKNINEVKKYLNKINYSAKYLLSFINNILDMSKIESGKITLLNEPYPLSELVLYIDGVIGPLCAERHQTLVKSIDTSLVIMTDRGRFNQVILNVLSNSCKYTPEGGTISITVAADSTDQPLLPLTITVADDGIGMSEEFQKHVFEPFRQENRPEISSVGTGLGLAIVKELIGLMDGKIEVFSKKGNGTSIVIKLSAERYEGNDVEQRRLSFDSLKNMHFLIFEDNEINSEILVRILEKTGASAIPVFNGKEGCERFVASPEGYFDAILMDLRMPIMNGYEATQTIRSMSRNDSAKIPILAVTADAFEDDRRRCLEAGMTDFLPKPIDVSLLLGLMQKYLGEKQ